MSSLSQELPGVATVSGGASVSADLNSFVADGKTFVRVGTSESDVESVDAWLRARNLPKLSTHLSIAHSLDQPLMLMYKSSDRNVLSVCMDERDRVKLRWLNDCRVRAQPDGERQVTYSTERVSPADKLAGCRVRELSRTSSRVTFGLVALRDQEVVAIKMPTRTPSGLDAGLEEWRCGVSVGGVPYWVYYAYLSLSAAGNVGYLLVEDQDGVLYVAETAMPTTLAGSLAAAAAASSAAASSASSASAASAASSSAASSASS